MTVYVDFRVVGEDLDPEVISRKLNIAPDSLGRKGEFVGRNKSVPARSGFWIISSKRDVESDVLEEHFWFLLKRLERSSDFFRSLSENYMVDFFTFLYIDESNPDISLSREAISAVAKLGASIDFDIYE